MKTAIIYQGVFPSIKGASGGDRRVRDFCIGLSYYSEKTYMLVPPWQNKNIENRDINHFEIIYVQSSFDTIPLLKRIFFWMSVCQFIFKNQVKLVLCYGSTFDCIPFIYYLRTRDVVVGHEMSDLASYSTTGIHRWVHLFNENLIPKFVDFTVGISDYICSHFKRVNRNAICIKVPILVDRNIFKYSEENRNSYRRKYGILDDEVLIAYLGATNIDEGVGSLMSVVKDLQSNYQQLKILIAGNFVRNNPLYDDIEAIAQNMDKDRILLAGWVATEEVLNIYSAADILVVPQVKSIFNKAALPTKLAEYSSMGKATVIASVGDIGQYFVDREHAMVYEASDTEALKQSIEELINNSVLREKLGQNIEKLAVEMFENRNAGLVIVNALKKEKIL